MFASYLPYANIYSNTPNFKGSLSITNYGSLIEKLSSTITLKRTSPFDFVSGFFSATEEGKGTIAPSNAGQSWFRNPGRIGGQWYADLDMLYEYSENVYFGLSIKNVFQTQAPTIPITPQIPRSFVFETGYKFKTDQRARIFLTNALEPAFDFSATFAFAIPALASEVNSVNSVKKNKKFSVV